MRSLPVPESVLKRHCEAIAPIFNKKRMQIIQVCCLCLRWRRGFLCGQWGGRSVASGT